MAIPFCHKNNKSRYFKLIAGDKVIYPGDRKIVNGEIDGASLANSQNNGVHESTSGSGFHKPLGFVRKGIFAHSITRRMFTTFKEH